MSHTPGPWNICWGTYNGARMNFHITASPHGSVLPIAETRWRHDHAEEDRQKIEANAHLIAAAPDLLEAAEQGLSLLEDPRLMKNEIDMAERFADVKKSLYAAISKAKGETE
jgi:hypothetical protein